MAIAAGRMDRRITFQTFTESQNGVGEAVKTWANLASNPTVWAQVEPIDGSEPFAAQQVTAEARTRFTIRYRSGISVEMRIVYASENYDIESLKELGRRDALQILAVKVQT